MAAALHYDLPQQELHPVFNKLDQELNSRGQGKQAADGGKFRLNVVNAVWGQRGYDFQMPYLDTLALNYGAGLRLLDFAGDSEGSREVINKWVEQMTEERIKDLLPRGSIDGLTRLVLTNAIYFNAAWATPFEETATKDGPFALVTGKQVTVPLMAGNMDGSYVKGTDYQAASLPYDGGELSMLVILPDEGKFDSVEQSLSTKFLDGVLGQMAGVKLDLTLPKFEIEDKMDLVPPLKAMGMQDAFSPGEADLSGIDGSRNLYVTGVLHKAFVKVNEAGTEAAAATAVIVGATSVPQFVTFKVDRPFIFMIRDHATGAIIFLGRVLDPS
jgi:serpin B